MADWDDVRRITLGLPETSEKESWGLAHWRVRDNLFAWERPLRKADYVALGENAPNGPILGVRTADLGVKEALLTDDPSIFFATPHFDGYPGVLVRLEQIPVDELEEVIIEAWLDRAPTRLANEYLEKSK